MENPLYPKKGRGKTNRARKRYSLSQGEKANALRRFAHRRKAEITSREHPSTNAVETGSRGGARDS